MKEVLTSFDLTSLISEWQDPLVAYVDKVGQAGKWLVLRKTEEVRETPGPFAMTLVKQNG